MQNQQRFLFSLNLIVLIVNPLNVIVWHSRDFLMHSEKTALQMGGFKVMSVFTPFLLNLTLCFASVFSILQG